MRLWEERWIEYVDDCRDVRHRHEHWPGHVYVLRKRQKSIRTDGRGPGPIFPSTNQAIIVSPRLLESRM